MTLLPIAYCLITDNNQIFKQLNNQTNPTIACYLMNVLMNRCADDTIA
jgi:hypothetical protein